MILTVRVFCGIRCDVLTHTLERVLPGRLGRIAIGGLGGCNLAELGGFDGLGELVFIGELSCLGVRGYVTFLKNLSRY